MANFFLVINPGLESMLAYEIDHKLPHLFGNTDYNYKIVTGGIELTCPINHGMQLNQFLKCPNKILLRFAEFKARDFPTLFKKIKQLPWKDYLRGETPKMQITSKTSRMIHTGRIEESIASGIQDYFKHSPPKLRGIKNNLPFELNVRIEDDLVTLSHNTSGPLLYKRGEEKTNHPAPLRETFASSIITYLIKNIDDINDYELFDPMCGSGTFLTEANNYYERLDRDFSYQNYPSYKMVKMNKFKDKNLFKELIGNDIELAPAQWLVKYSNIKLGNHDIYDLEQPLYPKTIVICNPPYGMRIDSNASAKHLQKVVGKLNDIGAQKIYMVVPDEYTKKLNVVLKFQNKGIKVNLVKL